MSRLGVVRWMSSLDIVGNNSFNSSLLLSSPSTSTKEEWMQTDAIISAFMIAILIVHAHFCSLTKAGMSTLFTLMSLTVTLLLAPIVGAVLVACLVYRQIAAGLMRVGAGRAWAGLLHGTDTFWAIEDDTSLSVINVLALADFSFIFAASTQDDEPLKTISELIQDRLLTTPAIFPKLACFRRLSSLGYFYWEKQETINITDHIRWMEIEDQGDQTITEVSLKNFVSSVMNAPLPANHAAGWEILVGRYPIKPSSDLFDAMENGGWITKSCAGIRYPVLFRIHHSIGDGVALVNLLLDSLADPCTRSGTPVSSFRPSSPSFNRNFVRPKTPAIVEESPVLLSWEESDIPKCVKSTSCDFKSICLDIPSESVETLKKSKSWDFSNHGSWDSNNICNSQDLKLSVRSACTRFLNFIQETKEFKTKLNQDLIKDFDIVVNDRPSAEFLDLIASVTSLENQLYKKPSGIRNKYFENLLKRSTITLCKLKNTIFNVVSLLQALVRQWSVLLFAPASLLNQALNQTQDINFLHGPKLSGHKVVSWYFEQQDNADQLLMSMIKRIRSKTGARFSDVLLTALSASLEAFYTQCNEVPQFITVVIPARLGPPPTKTTFVKTSKISAKVTKIGSDTFDNKLENKFSVAMLPLPISTGSNNNELRLFSKLRQVRRHCNQLRNSPDYLVNYWLLRVVATLLPAPLLRPLVASSHCTLVLSNLPGPARLTQLAGHTLHDLVFWIPNRTTTGVGVTVLSYAGRLQLGLMADRALVACQQDAQLILDGIATAIQQMDLASSPA